MSISETKTPSYLNSTGLYNYATLVKSRETIIYTKLSKSDTNAGQLFRIKFSG